MRRKNKQRTIYYSVHNFYYKVKKCGDFRKTVLICFIDFAKAFDKVKYNKLIEILMKTGVDNRFCRNW